MTHFWQNTSTEAPARQDRSPAPKSGRLGRRLVVHILLLNALLSLFASSIQLYASYQRDRSDVLRTLTIIEESFRSGFEKALWEYNFPLIEALLDGVASKPEIQFASLISDQGRTITMGELAPDGLPLETLTFTYQDTAGQSASVGRLDIQLTFEHIKARVWSQLWTLLLSNFVKTVCASVVMLFLFEREVGRYLAQIAARVTHSSWSQSDKRLHLERRGKVEKDDLDLIVSAINTAKQRNSEALDALKQEIAARERVELALLHRTEALEDANREQAQFTYAISHDLKSPANTIAMLLQEFELIEASSLSAESREVLDDAQQTVRRMSRLVEDILGYARTIEDGMKIEEVDLNNVAQELVVDLQGDIAAAEAQIEISDLPVVYGNRTQLRMLLQNLITNAVKFRSPERRPVIKLAGQASATPDCVKFHVSDNGIGIAPEYTDKVFGLFQRLHSYGAYEGTGLGLTLCKRIVTNHLGSISLLSQLGQGTTVEVTLSKESHGKATRDSDADR